MASSSIFLAPGLGHPAKLLTLKDQWAEVVPTLPDSHFDAIPCNTYPPSQGTRPTHQFCFFLDRAFCLLKTGACSPYCNLTPGEVGGGQVLRHHRQLQGDAGGHPAEGWLLLEDTYTQVMADYSASVLENDHVRDTKP